MNIYTNWITHLPLLTHTFLHFYSLSFICTLFPSLVLTYLHISALYVGYHDVLALFFFATLNTFTLTQGLIVLFFLKGYQVITTPLPSGGPLLVLMLNILEGFNFTKNDQDKSRTYHYMIEVRRRAFYKTYMYNNSRENKCHTLPYCMECWKNM